MEMFRARCMALYHMSFPNEPASFTEALFDRYFPECIRTVCENGHPLSMLFSIPYPLLTAKGPQEARYLYAVATHPDHRGKGLAKQLLAEEAAAGPVFLRPMSQELFTFYKKAGLAPISPFVQNTGDAAPADGKERLLSKTDYLTLRDILAPRPTCRPTETYLSLYESGGGFAAYGSNAAVLFERNGVEILFKEYWGDPVFAPRLTGFLGGTRYMLRRYDKAGTPFGMAAGIPAETAFLAAMD